MSFMPSPGAVVRLLDGREAVVSNATPLGNDDRVKFGDGHEGNIDAWQIAEVIEENG